MSLFALQKLVKGKTDSIEVENTALKEAIGKNIERGAIPPISEMIEMGKRFGRLKIYACVNSMALSNITRDELIDEVDSSIGLVAFMELVKDATTTLYI